MSGYRNEAAILLSHSLRCSSPPATLSPVTTCPFHQPVLAYPCSSPCRNPSKEQDPIDHADSRRPGLSTTTISAVAIKHPCVSPHSAHRLDPGAVRVSSSSAVVRLRPRGRFVPAGFGAAARGAPTSTSRARHPDDDGGGGLRGPLRSRCSLTYRGHHRPFPARCGSAARVRTVMSAATSCSPSSHQPSWPGGALLVCFRPRRPSALLLSVLAVARQIVRVPFALNQHGLDFVCCCAPRPGAKTVGHWRNRCASLPIPCSCCRSVPSAFVPAGSTPRRALV